jgi:hypothetical protein
MVAGVPEPAKSVSKGRIRATHLKDGAFFVVFNYRPTLTVGALRPREIAAAFLARGFATFEAFRSLSQNFSPAGVKSPFFARAMPTETTSLIPASGRKSNRLPLTCLKTGLASATPRPVSTSVMSELALSHSTAARLNT